MCIFLKIDTYCQNATVFKVSSCFLVRLRPLVKARRERQTQVPKDSGGWSTTSVSLAACWLPVWKAPSLPAAAVPPVPFKVMPPGWLWLFCGGEGWVPFLKPDCWDPGPQLMVSESSWVTSSWARDPGVLCSRFLIPIIVYRDCLIFNFTGQGAGLWGLCCQVIGRPCTELLTEGC